MEIEEYIAAEDRELVNRVLTAGDDVAFEFLFTRYRESIRRFLALKLGTAGGGSVGVDDLWYNHESDGSAFQSILFLPRDR